MNESRDPESREDAADEVGAQDPPEDTGAADATPEISDEDAEAGKTQSPPHEGDVGVASDEELAEEGAAEGEPGA